MAKNLDDFLLVSDESIYKALHLLIQHTHNLVEDAGAAAFAGSLSVRENLAGQKVVVVMSGGNISTGELKKVLNAFDN